jgi:ABC-2 type transport system ATP-binding protein
LTTPLLATHNLTKDYGSFRALDSLTLSIAPGEVFGLLGPNGSGKTTALRLLLGFLRPTHGTARIAGFDCWHHGVEARRLVAYLPGELRLYENMTGRRLVKFLAGLRGDTPGPEVDALAKRLDIDIDRPLTHLSSGMKRKVALLTVLIPKVPLIVLDEPTNTLDPTMRDELLDQLKQARRRGQAVLFSSHVLHEVETVCDRVGILRQGKIVHLQEMAELRDGRAVSARILGTVPVSGPNGERLPADAISDRRLKLSYRGPLPRLLDWLAKQSLDDLRIEPMGLAPIYKKHHEARAPSRFD